MNIEIVIKNKIASPTSDQRIVCGNSDYTITFQFDAEWDVEPVKTVRFTYRRHGRTYYKDQEFTGNTVPVPVLTRIHSVAVGVYAGNLRTTTPARITCTPSILCSDPSLEEDHPLPWVELRNDIGSLSDLNTSDKSSLVAAINEVLARGGSGGSAWIDPAEVERIVEEYLSDNPPAQGEDGFSPTVTITPISGGHRITFVDVNGDQTVDVMNGQDGAPGKPGEPGKDGYTPVKGVDYFTEDDITQVAQEAAKLVTIDQVTPDQVVFPDGASTTYAIGKVALVNGSGTLVEKGGTLADFFNVFVDEKTPTTTDPTVSLTFSQAKAYEVGTKVTPSYSASLNPGSYTYGPATGITATAWEVTDTASHKATSASGSFAQFQVTDGISYKITAKATHGAGATPVTNTGNAYEAGKIKAGTKSTTSGAVTGYRNTFYGTLEVKSDITSDIVRGLSGKSGKALVNGNSFTVTVPVGALRVIIAYPATLRDVNSIKDVNGLNAEIASGFSKKTVAVEGANDYKAIDYKVYTMDFATANDKANKFTVTI